MNHLCTHPQTNPPIQPFTHARTHPPTTTPFHRDPQEAKNAAKPADPEREKMVYYNETFRLMLDPLQMEAAALGVKVTKEDLERVKTQAREATDRHFSFMSSSPPPSLLLSRHSSVSSLTAPSPALTGCVSRDIYAQDALMLCDNEEEEVGFAPGAAVTAEELYEQHALPGAVGCPEPAAGNKRRLPPVEGGGVKGGEGRRFKLRPIYSLEGGEGGGGRVPPSPPPPPPSVGGGRCLNGMFVGPSLSSTAERGQAGRGSGVPRLPPIASGLGSSQEERCQPFSTRETTAVLHGEGRGRGMMSASPASNTRSARRRQEEGRDGE